LESGEYAHFEEGNAARVREIILPTIQAEKIEGEWQEAVLNVLEETFHLCESTLSWGQARERFDHLFPRVQAVLREKEPKPPEK
jgi:hypothetical protein